MTQPRRISVVLDGPPTPAWQARALALLEASPVLEVVERRLEPCARPSLARRLHAAGERHVFGAREDANAATDVAERPLGGSAPALVVWLAEGSHPDVQTRGLLRLRHEGIEEPLEDAFRRALLKGRPCIRTEVALHSGGDPVVLARTVSSTGPASELLQRSRALWKLADLIPRAVERAPGSHAPPQASASAGPPPPVARLLLRDLLSWTRAPATRALFNRPWGIRVRARGEALASGWERDTGLVRWGEARFYADPFLFEHGRRHHLFCEEVRPGSTQGVISHTELRLDGTPASAPAPVLVAPYHVSYPCVFAHDGEIFMIPETRAMRRIELYRAVSFPDSWQPVRILLDCVSAADATLLHHDGRLWLFTTIAAEGASSSDELHLFLADSLEGPWRAHPRNPVVSDVRGARPAGAIQRWGERLVRPAQDCSRRYGWALSFREIETLNEEDYGEREIERLEPGQVGGFRATHTYAADRRFEAIDVRWRQLRARRPASRRA
jgi:hypothetical protein